MAWWAEQKRRNWFCVVEMDMIAIYHNKLYDEWYASLTEEEIEKLERAQKIQDEEDRRQAMRALGLLVSMANAMIPRCMR